MGSRFYDALASDCFPVILSDSWRLTAAPFADRLNYDSFTFTLPTGVFQRDPRGALDWVQRLPRDVMRRRFAAMQEAKKVLLFNHKQSQTHEWVLREALEAVKVSMATK